MRNTVVCALVAVIASVLTTKAPQLIDMVEQMSTPVKKEAAGFWQTPTINGYGKIHYDPQAAFMPDPHKTYRIVFQIAKTESKTNEVNTELDHVARTVNLYVASGVPLSQLDFVVAIAGKSTPLVLNNEQYRKHFNIDNPNLELLKRLKEAGVKVTICEQALGGHHYKKEWVDDNVIVALSSLTTLTTLEEKGYALMPM